MAQELNDFDALVATGSGDTLIGFHNALPAALRREFGLAEYIGSVRNDAAKSSVLGFRPSDDLCTALVALLARFPAEVSAGSTKLTGKSLPGADGGPPARPVNAVAIAGGVQCDTGAVTRDGTGSGLALVHEAHVYNTSTGAWTYSGTLTAAAHLTRTGFTTGQKVAVVSVDTSGRRSAPTAFVTVP